MRITSILKGAGGDFEINRTMGALGTVAYIAGANGFTAWGLWRGDHFDLVAYCAAFPVGLGAAIGSIAGAVAIKDRSVATSKVIADTGTVPSSTTGSGAPPVQAPPA